MATSGKEVRKQAQAIKRELGMRGTLQPGDLTKKAREVQSMPAPKAVNKKLPPSSTVKGVAFRGLI